MSRRGFNNARAGGHRDAKQLSRNNKNRFARLDPDISSRYEDLDDEPSVPVRAGSNLRNRLGRPNPFERKNESVANSGVRNADVVFKVRVIQGAKKFDRKWLVKHLNQKIENFKPLLLDENNRGDYEFYVRDDEIAQAVRMNSKRIMHKESNTRVEFHVTKAPAPWMSLKKSEIDLINQVVDKRHNAENRMLDLSDFGQDIDFTSQDLNMTLTKGNVMLAVLDRIDDKYGNVTAITLAKNRLRHLDYASSIVSIAKFVKVLDLSHNLIATEKELTKFQGLPVENIYFEGNPIIEAISIASEYLSMIQRVFPRCSMLDGEAVQPLVSGPDNSTDEAIPYRAGYYAEDQIREIVERFIIDFFQFYDGVDGQRTRKQLFEAYDESNSKFTLTISNINGAQSVRYPNDECYDNYIRQSHNILTQEYFARNRSARTVRGSMDIAVALSKLPMSSHMKETFVVDVFLVSNELLGFTVQGLFQDGDLTKVDVPSPNFFSRTFTVAPREGGRVAVLSDQLFISSASQERLTRYKKLLDKAAENGAAVSPANAVTQATVGVNGIGFDGAPQDDVKTQMIAEFCRFSGMVVTWSEKCLADFGWDFNAACAKFLEIKDTVPAEAFAT